MRFPYFLCSQDLCKWICWYFCLSTQRQLWPSDITLWFSNWPIKFYLYDVTQEWELLQVLKVYKSLGKASSSWEFCERSACVVFLLPLCLFSKSETIFFLSLMKEDTLPLHLKTWLAHKPAILYGNKTHAITVKVTTLGFIDFLLGFLLLCPWKICSSPAFYRSVFCSNQAHCICNCKAACVFCGFGQSSCTRWEWGL